MAKVVYGICRFNVYNLTFRECSAYVHTHLNIRYSLVQCRSGFDLVTVLI